MSAAAYAPFALLLLILAGCGITDLRTDRIREATPGQLRNLRTRGRALLDSAYRTQGLDRLTDYDNYTFVAHEEWMGAVGKLANPWSVNDVDLRFTYRINSFDGRVEVISGEREGHYVGLQSWRFYRGVRGDAAPEFPEEPELKRVFAIPTFQYFVELPLRLRNAPIAEYAGAATLGERVYDLVLVTWGADSAPTSRHDHYLCYVNRATGLLELCSYSVREGYLPGAKYLNGNIHYSDFEEVAGVLLPMTHESTFLAPALGKTPVHRLSIRSVVFREAPDATLTPDPDLVSLGDEKPTD